MTNLPAPFSRYDYDPDALAWARARWRWIAKFMHRELIGSGEGCVITAFDERLPEWAKRIDNALIDRAILGGEQR